VELKIHAGLSSIQNPAKREFGLADGYGGLFNTNFGFRGEILRFVLLGAEQLDLRKRPWNLPIRVQQRYWKDLADDLPSTSVSKDLAISLGMLGIDAFPAAEVKNMKVDTRQREFAKASSILREVERRLAWPRGRSKRDFGFEKGDWYLGVGLFTSDKEPAKSLKSRVRPLWTYMAWFGYHGEEGGPPSLGVELFCGSGESRNKIATQLRAKLRGCSIDATAPPEYNEFHLIVDVRRHRMNNDCEWFCSVFRTLGVQTIA
jgi:hypothetical protein